MNSSLGKLNNQFNIDHIHDLNREMITGKYNNLLKNLKVHKPICLGEKSPDDCVCPAGKFNH